MSDELTTALRELRIAADDSRALRSRARGGSARRVDALRGRPCCACTRSQRLTAQVTRTRYPDLNVPPHSRFTHFDAGGVRAARGAGARARGADSGHARARARADRRRGHQRAARRRRRRELAVHRVAGPTCACALRGPRRREPRVGQERRPVESRTAVRGRCARPDGGRRCQSRQSVSSRARTIRSSASRVACT